MTIRETTAIQKKNHHFSLIKRLCFCFGAGLVFLLAFSNPLLAQQDGVIISSDFESNKPLVNTTVNKVTELSTNKDNTLNKQMPQDTNVTMATEESNTKSEQKPLSIHKTIPVENEKPSKQIQSNKVVKLLPLVANKGFAELEQKLITQQGLLEQLSARVSELNEQNQILESNVLALQVSIDKQRAITTLPTAAVNKYPKLKTQVINLAIQTSLLKPETLAVKAEKSTVNKDNDSAWYEKLVVVKKIEKKQETKQSTTSLYALLKQFDLLQLALDTNNQQQWQTTLQNITANLQNQYPKTAQEIIQQLKELQAQNIAVDTQLKNPQAVDAKFGIK